MQFLINQYQKHRRRLFSACFCLCLGALLFPVQSAKAEWHDGDKCRCPKTCYKVTYKEVGTGDDDFISTKTKGTFYYFDGQCRCEAIPEGQTDSLIFAAASCTNLSETGGGDEEEVEVSEWDACNQVTSEDQARCQECLGSEKEDSQSNDNSKENSEEEYQGPKGVWTAIGCIPISTTGIVSTLVKIGVSLCGFVSLVSIIVGAFQLSTSRGDAKRVAAAKQTITSAIIGLLFFLFSTTILQFIGITILHIPGFGDQESKPTTSESK